MLRFLAAVAAVAASLSAHASCGAAFCMVNTGFSASGVWTEPGTRLDVPVAEIGDRVNEPGDAAPADGQRDDIDRAPQRDDGNRAPQRDDRSGNLRGGSQLRPPTVSGPRRENRR